MTSRRHANDNGNTHQSVADGLPDPLAKFRLLHSDEVAKLIGVSPTRLCIWRGEGKGPAFVRVEDKLIRYRLSTVLKWFESRESPPQNRYPLRADFQRRRGRALLIKRSPCE